MHTLGVVVGYLGYKQLIALLGKPGVRSVNLSTLLILVLGVFGVLTQTDVSRVVCMLWHVRWNMRPAKLLLLVSLLQRKS